MDKIVVTGSAGKTGPFVIEEFGNHGYEVYGVDRNEDIRSSAAGDIRGVRADLTSLGETIEAFEGASAVVHLANVALPGLRPPTDTFIENVSINYNVFRAAGILGVDTVVWLSSAAVAEQFFGDDADIPVPLGRETLVQPASAYALSKAVTEYLAGHVATSGGCVVGLRAPLIEDPKDYAAYSRYHHDPDIRRWHMWSYIDARDVARACRLAVERRPPGVTNMFISAPDTVMDCDIADLFRLRFPGRTPPPGLAETGAFISNRQANELIGFEPKHSWRDGR